MNKTDTQMATNLNLYHDYLDRLLNIAYSMFEWEGLPEGINERYLEKSLHLNGQVLFFESPEFGYLTLRFVGSNLNVYEEFTDYRVHTSTGHAWERNDKNAVAIWNNPQKKATYLTLQLYAEKLYECDSVIRTNIKAMKTPVLIIGTKQQQLTLKNLYMQYDGNEPVIYGDKGLDLNSINVLKTDAPFIADKITQLKHDVWSECLTYLGINSTTVDKKERLVADEAKANEDHSEHNVQVMLKERQEACKRINEMFGLNVSVKLRSQEGEENGEVYDDDQETE